MSMAHSRKEIKGKSLVELAEQLEASIRNAAQAGKSLYEVEKDTFGCALRIGHAAIEQLLMLEGNGDVGESVASGWPAGTADAWSGARNRRSALCERCLANIPSGPTCMLREVTKRSNSARLTRG